MLVLGLNVIPVPLFSHCSFLADKLMILESKDGQECLVLFHPAPGVGGETGDRSTEDEPGLPPDTAGTVQGAALWLRPRAGGHLHVTPGHTGGEQG